MKAIKRLIPLFVCLMMISALSITAFAANDQANVYGELTATQVEVDEEFTFTLYNKEMTAAAFKAGFYFDNTKLEVSKITFQDIMCYNEDEEDFVEADLLSKTTKKKANTDGSALGVYTFNSGVDSLCEEGVIVEVKFKAIAEGIATITLREETLGTSAFESDSVETLTVTIGTVAPECSHESTKLVSNDNGTHNEVCANTECGATVTPNVTCSGTDDGDCTTAVTCECGNVVTAAKAAHVAGADDGDCTTAIKCVNCEKNAVEAKAAHSFNSKASDKQASAANCTNPAKNYVQCDNCNAVSDTKTVEVGTATGHGKVLSFRYNPNSDGTHNVVCADCNQTTEENVKCEDGDDADELCDKCGNNLHVCAHDHYEVTANNHQSICSCGEKIGEAEAHSYDAESHKCVCGAKFTGWDGKVYYKDAVMQTGWTEIDGAWYYLDPETGIRAEGLTRVPYPTVDINGWGYEPNPEDIAYAEKKGETFIDADEAWFLFDEYGKFNQDSGIMEYEGAKRYLHGGIMEWHIGMVTEDGVNYYFVGDAEIGGNKAAEGIVYITRIAGYDDFKPGYVIFKDGQIDDSKDISIESVTNSKGETNSFYFENGICVPGKGLVMIEEGKYIFVRSVGQLAIGEYWVTPEKANGLVKGGRIYVFDENGYMTSDVSKNGIVDGKYYVEGELTYAGLIKIDGDIYYINSKGEVVTGTYYVTKTNGMEGFSAGDKLVFGEDGKMETIKDGIVEENGELYYYNKNHLMCGAGLIEIDGDIYYVRSSGKVQTGYFYITNTNDMEGFAAGDLCKFGEDGKLLFVCE